jgi:hypothetical protein
MARQSAQQARLELSHLSNEGVLTDLTYGGLTFWDGRVGTGMPPVRRITEQGPSQHGVSDLGFRLDQRTVGLVLTFTGIDDTAVERKQERIYGLFKPRDVAYKLRFRTPGRRRTYQIDCHTTSGPDFSSAEMKDGGRSPIYRAALQVYAPDPVFYDPSLHVVSFGLTGGGGAWTIPWVIPWGIGSSTLNQTTNVIYAGNWLEYPIITVVGPITNAIIANAISGDAIDFTGATIAAGVTYTIDLRPGHRSVVDQAGTNQIATLADGSDMATWSLLPDPDAPGGINPITVSGSGVTEATQVYLQYYDRYVGIA